MEEKTNKTSEISENNFNYFSFLSNEKGAFKLIKSYKIFIKEYHDACKQFREFIFNAESNFLNEKGLESYVINTPFFQFGKEIKKILKVQREQLDSILESQVFTLERTLHNLYGEFKTFKRNDEIFKEFINKIHDNLNDLERKLIDDYINDNYLKHIKDISNREKKIFLLPLIF